MWVKSRSTLIILGKILNFLLIASRELNKDKEHL